ncbi:hypothetical protein F5Y12DRAFT_98706 [Xylaria sp. FL1777]|nr:hypothetical protein F5Y12DRAFT_98706 [Xylaria sp. FL1777]
MENQDSSSNDSFLDGQDAEAETLLMANHEMGIVEKRSFLKLNRCHVIFMIVNFIITLALLSSIIIIWTYDIRRNGKCDANFEQHYYYSPALEATKPASRITQFNNTKWSPYNPDSGNSLDEVNKKWTNILSMGLMGLTPLELERVGGSADSVVLPPESGGGYLAYLASHHHLHCLYLLHQSLHQEYYATRSRVWEMSAERRTSHWDHCVEELRQAVMCAADSTVLTHDWYEHVDLPVPNGSNLRRCADWDAHWQWQLDRQAPAPKEPLTKPPGAKERAVQPDAPPSWAADMYWLPP